MSFAAAEAVPRKLEATTTASTPKAFFPFMSYFSSWRAAGCARWAARRIPRLPRPSDPPIALVLRNPELTFFILKRIGTGFGLFPVPRQSGHSFGGSILS
jgi:hypothetical protein